jgi:hypothetical protein
VFTHRVCHHHIRKVMPDFPHRLPAVLSSLRHGRSMARPLSDVKRFVFAPRSESVA